MAEGGESSRSSNLAGEGVTCVYVGACCHVLAFCLRPCRAGAAFVLPSFLGCCGAGAGVAVSQRRRFKGELTTLGKNAL